MKQPVQFTSRSILLIMLTTFSVQVWGLDCSTSPITLSTQAEVDNFQINYGNGSTCDTVTGDLWIQGNDISDLDGLSALTSVGYRVVIIGNPDLLNIDGLANLTSVQAGITIDGNQVLTDLDALVNITDLGYLVIQGNSSLTNVDGLSGLTNLGDSGTSYIGANSVLVDLNGLANLQSVGKDFYITGNALTDLNGLQNLVSVAGDFIIQGNSALANVNGLNNLTSVGRDLRISSNATLANINALSNLTSVGLCLCIGSNPVLTDIDGLVNLTSVGGALAIQSNDALTNIDSLINLNALTYFIISSNPVLTNIDGLGNLTSVGVEGMEISSNNTLINIDGLTNLANVSGYLSIKNNSTLENCTAIARLLGWPDGPPNDNVGEAITVVNNNSGCNGVQEILDLVSGPTAPFIIASEAAYGQATVTFSSSTTTDALWPVTGYQAQCISDNQFGFQNTAVLGIPDLGSVVSPLIVSNVPFSNAAGLSIPINITHPRTRHLTVTLKSPSGTSVLLWDEVVGTGTDLVGTFPTTLTPAESLDAFNGLDFNGEWQITVADGVASHIGTLNSWGLTIMGKVTAISAGSPIVLTGLADSQPYSCDVSAITGLGKGPASNIVSVTPPPELIFDNGFEE